MMKRAFTSRLTWIWALLLVMAVPVFAQPARIAVAGDTSLANLVDVMTGELSKDPNLAVLDRADLDKLGQEQALQAVLNARDYAPVRLLPADGLVLLRATGKKGKAGLSARLVAVQPGVVLREVSLPDGDDPVAQAQALAAEFAPFWGKLASIQKGNVRALSLLGLRFETDAPETRELERRINILLASSLSAEPDTLVLERWRLKDALFEKTLSLQPPAPFWSGGNLIDGSMRLKDHQVIVALRLRPPQGPEISLSDQDSTENLPALVERLATKIHNRPLAAGAWKPHDEALHFAQLGNWGIANHLYGEGADAIESALALGDDSRTTRMLQIKAYAMLAYPNPSPHALRGIVPESDDFRGDLISVESVPRCVAAATEAAHLMRIYMNTYRGFTSKMWNEEVPEDLCVPVLYNCLRTLRAAYELGWTARHADETAGLRHELQLLIGTAGEILLPQPASLKRGAYLNNRAFYAGLWHDKPEETIAFYRQILQDKDGAWMRGMLFQSYCAHEPYLDGAGTPAVQGPRSVGPPWIVAWDGRSPLSGEPSWRNWPPPIHSCRPMG